MGKKIVFGIGVLVLLVVVAFGLELLGLQWTRFFKPRYADVEREVFEETKSYVHGKIQDLAKYYGEYQAADGDGKIAIQAVIKVRFAEFDAKHVESEVLRSFLVKTRGY